MHLLVTAFYYIQRLL